MSTLSLRAPHGQHVWHSFARLAGAVATVLDVFTEARLRALAAHKQLPFADW